MEQTKKLLAVVLAIVLSLSLLPATSVSAASKKVKLNKTKATIYVGKTVTLKLRNNKKKVKWSTSNKKVATVTKKGKVKGKKAGKATITAKVGKKKYKCKITVKKKAKAKPTTKPTTKPVEQPTTKPTEKPTTKPVEQPTTKPTEEPTTGSNKDWKYVVTDKGITLSEYIGKDTEVVIPSEINGQPVTRIDGFLFGEMDEGNPYSDVTSITIPKSITYIDVDAFQACAVLKTKLINNSLLNAEEANYWRATLYDEEINGLAIRDKTIIKAVSKDITEAVIPDGITKIKSSAFSNCKKLANITIPESVTSIGSCAFSRCSSLTNITIPDGVTSVEWGTFSDCGELEKITIPQSVTYISPDAFGGCYILRSGVINNSTLEIWDYHFFNGMLYDEKINGMYIADKTVVGVFDKDMKELDIPEGVTSVASVNLRDCSSLANIIIPSSVTSISSSAFEGCYILRSNFKNKSSLNVEEANYWGAKVYDEQSNGLYIESNSVIGVVDKEMEEVDIPSSVTSIGDGAFWGCSSLTNVTISSSVTSIGDWAFCYCDSLASVTIPSSVTSIGNRAFEGCSSLTSVTIPSSVTSIGSDAFSSTPWLESHRENYLVIVNNILIDVDESVENVTIPANVTSIGDEVFLGCSSLTSVTIPSSVTSIGNRAFCYCDSLASVTIPSSVTIIEDWAFGCCSSLTSVTIPNSVTSIGSDAFLGCSSLTSIQGEEGSYAETWAKENGYTFVAE